MWSIIFFLIAIITLVTVHELGHFIVARICGVKVIRFSVGFGKVLWSIHDKKGTEYAISAIPLGGYVKMLDEREGIVSPRDLPFAFNQQSPLKRIAIVSAGPLFNWLFAIIAYVCMYWIGLATIIPLIGSVIPHSPADKANIQPGYEILAVNEKPTNSWEDVQLIALQSNPANQTLNFTLKNRSTGDEQKKHLAFSAGNPEDPFSILNNIGIRPYMPTILPVIAKVLDNTPASKAGLMAKDKIISIDNNPVSDWLEMVNFVAKHPNQRIMLTIQRNDQQKEIPIFISSIMQDGEQVGYLGVQSLTPDWPNDLVRITSYSLDNAFIAAIKKTCEMTLLSYQFLWRMVIGEFSLSHMSGPIGIAEGAGYSAERGFSYFLGFLALLSISLAVINSLPIPVLDGGHLVYYLYELITKKPISEKVQTIATQLGIFLLLAVMILTFYNDITRW